jgi:hypothetical protein
MRPLEIIRKDGNLYEVLEAIPRSNFTNKDQSLNGKVIGLYVKQIGADRVLDKEGKVLFCKCIEEANLI